MRLYTDSSLSIAYWSKAHIRNDEHKSPSSPAHTYHALLTPHRTELSLLSLSPVLPKLELYDFGIEFVPLEPDLLSLEEEGAAWKDLYITGDQTVLHRSAMALMTCQMLWGCFPKITGKGNYSKRLADLLMRQRREHLAGDPTNPSLTTLSTVIDGLVIVERGMDMATPMCSQLTYMGLLDEVFGVKSAHVEVDPALLNTSSTPQGPSSTSTSTTGIVTPSTSRPLKKHRLDPTTDILYSQIRDLNFSTVGSVLHSFAKRLSTSYQDRHSAKTVSEMRAFVGKLGGLQSEHTALRLHTALTEQLMGEANSDTFNRSLEIQQNIVAGVNLNAQMTAIEDLIIMEAPVTVVLRLLCLLSTTSGGIKPKNLDSLKRDICQTYGYEHLTTLLNLERAGVLTKIRPPSAVSAAAAASTASRFTGSLSGATNVGSSSGGVPAFERVRQPLRLINDEVSESDPTDVAYVYSGYAPLSIRVVQAVGQKEALVGTLQSANSSSNSSGKPTSSNARNGAAGAGAGGEARSKPRAHPLVGWKGFEDVLGAIPGETFDFAQPPNLIRTSSRAPPPAPPATAATTGGSGSVPSHSDPTPLPTSSTAAADSHTYPSPLPGTSTDPNLPWSTDPDRPRTTVVFFLGGITYAEIAALRFMSSRSRNRRWLIATTGIISGGRIVQIASGK